MSSGDGGRDIRAAAQTRMANGVQQTKRRQREQGFSPTGSKRNTALQTPDFLP